MRAFKNILFFVLLLVILTGISIQTEKAMIKNKDYVQTRNKNIYQIRREPENRIDMVMIGDSLSYTSVSPMELWEDQGIASYIGGQPGQNIQEAYHMLKTILKKQSPKLVILETNTLYRDMSGVKGLKNMLEEWGNYHIPLFRGHDIWKSFLTGKKYTEESYQGFSFRCEVTPYKKGNYMKKSGNIEEIPERSAIYMGKIRKLCLKNNVRLLLVSTPSPLNYTYSRHNGIKKYAKEYSLEYLDMNLDLNKIDINWKTDSLDGGDHLNFLGAQKVTKYLEKYLEKHHKLPDHRKDKGYMPWRSMNAKYQKEAEKNMKKMLGKTG